MTTPSEEEARAAIRKAIDLIERTDGLDVPAWEVRDVLLKGLAAASRVSTPPPAKPSTDEDIEALRADLLVQSPEQRRTEVIVAHRIGFWNITESYPDTTTEEIALADEELERYVQDRIAAVSTPPSEDWEYGTVSEITSAQVINGAHIDYWRSRGFDIVRRRRATEWEPVPAVPVLPTEPAMIACPHWSPGQITMRKGCTACAASAPTEPEEKR